MKTQENIEVVDNTPTIAKIAEIKSNIESLWDIKDTKEDIVIEIEQGYIFGKYANSEHYSREFILQLVDEIYLEKNPLPIVEPIAERVFDFISAMPIVEEVINPVEIIGG